MGYASGFGVGAGRVEEARRMGQQQRQFDVSKALEEKKLALAERQADRDAALQAQRMAIERDKMALAEAQSRREAEASRARLEQSARAQEGLEAYRGGQLGLSRERMGAEREEFLTGQQLARERMGIEESRHRERMDIERERIKSSEELRSIQKMAAERKIKDMDEKDKYKVAVAAVQLGDGEMLADYFKDTGYVKNVKKIEIGPEISKIFKTNKEQPDVIPTQKLDMLVKTLGNPKLQYKKEKKKAIDPRKERLELFKEWNKMPQDLSGVPKPSFDEFLKQYYGEQPAQPVAQAIPEEREAYGVPGFVERAATYIAPGGRIAMGLLGGGRESEQVERKEGVEPEFQEAFRHVRGVKPSGSKTTDIMNLASLAATRRLPMDEINRITINLAKEDKELAREFLRMYKTAIESMESRELESLPSHSIRRENIASQRMPGVQIAGVRG